MKNYKKSSGFTMAELLIVIGILGIIAAIMIPSMRTTIPTKAGALMKKGAYELEHAVSDLVTSDELYERTDVPDNTNHTMLHLHGLMSTYRVQFEGNDYGTNEDYSGDDTDCSTAPNPSECEAANTSRANAQADAEQKFCRLLATRFQLREGTEVNCSSDANLDNPSFISVDGIQWVIPISDFRNGPEVILYRTLTDDDRRAKSCAVLTNTQFRTRYADKLKAAAGIDDIDSTFKTNAEDCKYPGIGVYLVYPDGTLHKESATSDKVLDEADN